MSSNVLALMAGSWGVLMALSPSLQIRAIVRRRSSAGVSLGYVSVLFVGFVLWLSYGLSTADTALVVTNSASLAVSGATIVVILRYRPRSPVDDGAKPLTTTPTS